MQKFALGSLLVIGMSIVSIGCGGDSKSTAQATPEDAAKGFQQALANNDWESATEYMTDESADMMLFPMVLGASFVAMDNEEAGKSLENLLKEHGVNMDESNEPSGDMEAAMHEAFSGVKNKGACLAAIVNWINENAPEDQRDEPFQEISKAQFGEAKIDGDKATISMTFEDEEEVMILIKKDGKWYVDIKASQEASMARAMQDIPPMDIELDGPEITTN